MTSLIFAGKIELQATGSSNPYLIIVVESGSSFPSMSSPQSSSNTRFTLYDTGNGLLIQSSSGLYLALQTSLNWIQAVSAQEEAGLFSLTDNGDGTMGLSVFAQDDHAWYPVQYSLNINPDLAQLTISRNAEVVGLGSAYLQTVVTPGVTAMQASGLAAKGDFDNVMLAGADLQGVVFDGSSFAGATLIELVLRNATFRGCGFSGASVCGCDISGAVFDGADLSGVVLSGLIWSNDTSARGTSFRDCSAVALTRQDSQSGQSLALDGSDLTGASFTLVDLTEASMNGTAIDGSSFTGCNFTGVNLGVAQQLQSGQTPLRFDFSYFSATAFGALSLYGASFTCATFDDNITFSGVSTLEQACFAGAYAADVVFDRVMMAGADMPSACLIGASFSGATLTPSGTKPANFIGALLQAATFTAASLAGALLTNAVVSFQSGRFPLQYADVTGALFPPVPLLMNYRPTVGLLEALQPSTVCANGLSWQVVQVQGLTAQQAMTAACLATAWLPPTRLPRPLPA